MTKNKKKKSLPITDAVFYINLDKRLDREKMVENDLKKIFNNVTRVSAEDGDKLNVNKNIAGAVGCAYSHIKALKMGLESGVENIFIFEDDFQLEVSTSLANTILKNIKDSNFNLVLLSYHMPLVKLSNFKNNLAEIENGQTTCAYVVKRDYANTLINLFTKSIDGLIETESLNIFSIDQMWKVIQTKENKTYGAIPRLGKQRKSFSDILNENVDYGGTCFMGILSCEKYKNRRAQQSLKGIPFDFKYFIGKPSLIYPIVKGNIVYLPCGDNYEDLSDKTYHMVKWILENIPHIDYIFKTDDDIKFDFEKLQNLYSEIVLNKFDYSGNIADGGFDNSEYHYGKCENKALETVIKLDDIRYCSGGGYFLSRKSSDILLNEMKKHSIIFEDYSVGKTLNKNNINPIGVDIQNKACFW